MIVLPVNDLVREWSERRHWRFCPYQIVLRDSEIFRKTRSCSDGPPPRRHLTRRSEIPTTDWVMGISAIDLNPLYIRRSSRAHDQHILFFPNSLVPKGDKIYTQIKYRTTPCPKTNDSSEGITTTVLCAICLLELCCASHCQISSLIFPLIALSSCQNYFYFLLISHTLTVKSVLPYFYSV